MSLLPEKPLLIHPSLAATLGLEEAVLLQVLGELRDYRSTASPRTNEHWCSVDLEQLLAFLPFWQAMDLERIVTNLRDKGVLSVNSAPLLESGYLEFSLESLGKKKPYAAARAQTRQASGARLIANQWQPGDDTFRQLAQYNISQQFAEQHIPEFVTYWRERNEPHYSWESKFIKWVLKIWRSQETTHAKKQSESAMRPMWRPSSDAIDILNRQAGISVNFIEDAIPEFVLYWQERGDSCGTWNSRFTSHVRHQWARYTSAMEHDTTPRPLLKNWQPSESLFDVLQLANIPRTFAERQVPEFILYWTESGQAYGSWNTRFLQQVKRQWAKQRQQSQDSLNEKQQGTGQPVRTRDRSLEEDLTDRSWAR